MAFPIVLGFVAGFVDIFGFLAWHGLLTAHVTGNLIFIAVGIARGTYQLAMKLLALPIFALAVAISAWAIEVALRRDRQPLLVSIVCEATLIGLCLAAGFALPTPQGPDAPGAMVPGVLALFAMGLQNTIMRKILDNLPATTVMTGNVTYVVSEAVGWVVRHDGGLAAVGRRGWLIVVTLASFTGGAIAGGLGQTHIGNLSLVVPVVALLILLPLARCRGSSAT